jgi:hypothetical protein
MQKLIAVIAVFALLGFFFIGSTGYRSYGGQVYSPSFYYPYYGSVSYPSYYGSGQYYNYYAPSYYGGYYYNRW